MAADPTVVAIPFYFGSMEAERRYLKRRSATIGPSAADYTPADTRASLTMGVASLVVPLASHLLVRAVVPGKGRFGRALVGTAVGAAVVTTVADRLAGHDGRGGSQRLSRRGNITQSDESTGPAGAARSRYRGLTF